MKLSLRCATLVLVTTLISGSFANPVADAVAAGDIDKAGRLLDSLVAESSIGRGEQSYWEGILTESAVESERFLKEGIALGLDSLMRIDALERIAHFRLLFGDSLLAAQGALDSDPQTAQQSPLIARILAAHLGAHASYDSSLKLIDAGIVGSKGSEWNQWWMVDKARVLIESGKAVGGTKILKNLAKEKKGEGIPMSLYMLSLVSFEKKETDKAALYFNLLRDAYPHAIGIDALVDKLSEVEISEPSQSKAEKLTGTFYSVQVGVFSDPENARRGADLFQNYKLPVEIVKKKISNVMYNVVFVGHFSDYHEALRTKTMLESKHNESYQVVAR